MMFDWKFTFLGADQDAFAEASAMGMDAAGAANFSKEKIAAAYSHTGAKVERLSQPLENVQRWSQPLECRLGQPFCSDAGNLGSTVRDCGQLGKIES